MGIFAGAPAAVSGPDAPASAPAIDQFYGSSAALCDAVADFLAAGAAAGEPLLVIATEEHRAALAERLLLRGAEGADITALDAEEALARVMVDGQPDAARFREVVDGALDEIARRRPDAPVRAYGEIVDVLWRTGHTAAALALEGLWHDLLRRRPLSLRCAYALGSFYKLVDLQPIGTGQPRVALPEGAAEQAVGLHERQLETIIDSLPTLVSFVDADGRYRFVNRAYQRWFGVAREAIVGRHLRDVVGEAAYQALLPHVESALAGETVTYERRVPYDAAGERYIEATYVPHRGHDGEVLGFSALVSDISERKRQEAARSAAEKYNRRLLSVTAAVADAVSREEVFEAVVDEAAVSLGASSAGLFLLEADGSTVRLVRSTGYRAETIPTIDGLPMCGEVRLPALDTIERGEPMWIESPRELVEVYPHLAAHVSPDRCCRIACLPIRSHAGTLGALAFTFDDAPPIDDGQRSFLLLTARYCGQALERLRLLDAERLSREQAEDARVRAELLHQLARAIIVARGIDDVYQAALGAIGRALATERSAVLVFDGGGVMRFVAQRGLSERYQRGVEGHSPWRPEEVDPQPLLVPDVASAPELAGFLPLLESESIGALGFFPLVAGGRLLGKFMVYHDRPRAFAPQEVEMAMAIAHHVGAAVVRFAAVGELERAVRFNEMFTGILGHDLRNPLHAIMTAANVAVLRGDGGLHKPITRILRSGERMSRMIDQLLDFTRVRTGAGIPLDSRPVDLATLVRQVADELEDANPEWTFSLEVTGDTVGAWDPDRLAQVFSNLIGNAVQHGIAAGGVRITIDGSDGARVRVEVHNQGAIPRDQVARVFEPMSGTDARRARSQGLGLGLFITEQIARAHGGAVSVQSSEELGTIFTVVLPRFDDAKNGR